MNNRLVMENSKSDTIRIRRMVIGDWHKLIDAIDRDQSANSEASNYADGDANVEFSLGHDWCSGFFVAENMESGQFLGHVTAVKHGKYHGYIGGYYVQNAFAQGDIGFRLLQAAMEYLKGRNILADFKLAAFTVPLYETEILSQFKESNWCISRYVGMPSWDKLPIITNQQLYVCHAQMIRIEDMSEFDRTISGQNRTEWLRRFLRHHSNNGWIPKSVQLIITDRRGDIRGYGCIRPGSRRAKIGPVYARDLKAFFMLLRNLIGSSRDAKTRGVEAVVCNANRQAIDVMENLLGLQRIHEDECKRFYTKWHPHIVVEQAYCFTNANTQFI